MNVLYEAECLLIVGIDEYFLLSEHPPVLYLSQLFTVQQEIFTCLCMNVY